jgi:hypothetical protein
MMTLTQQVKEKIGRQLHDSPLSPRIQQGLEVQSAILVLSAAAYQPLTVDVRVASLSNPTVEVILHFPESRNLVILTSWHEINHSAGGLVNDTFITSYNSQGRVGYKAAPHSKAPEVIKGLLHELGLSPASLPAWEAPAGIPVLRTEAAAARAWGN